MRRCNDETVDLMFSNGVERCLSTKGVVPKCPVFRNSCSP